MAYLQIIAGCFIGAAAYPAFLTPNSIAPGGLSGLAMVVNYLFPALPIGITTLMMNVPLFLIGRRTMGNIFFLRSLIATVLFSILIDLIPIHPVSADPLLGSLYGGVLLGIGLGLILRGGATTGGTDMVARLIHHKYSFVTVGMFLFALDFAVVCFSGAVIGISQALYAFINIFVSGKVIDTVMAGFNTSKACYIISDNWQKISNRLMTELGRGVTQLKASGAYTGKDRPVILCVANRT